MRTWYFSENAYPYLPDPSTYESIRVSLPNKHFDPKVGSELYKRYFDEWELADELGLDLMVNEHHQTATNLNPSAAVATAVLARITKKGRLLILGNPIANRRDPIRVAEEMAMIDNYSAGRLECGFVRGVPYESAAANANPVRMVDRFWESHDLIVKAWTSHEGPFNWEGRYFNYRQVNIWPRPYQQPHPPIWITSTTTNQITRIAEHNYVAATFLTGYEQTKTIFDAYRAKRTEMGQTTAEDRLAYAALIYVGETDEEGFAGARKLLWYLSANKVPLEFRNPPGYASLPTAAKLLKGAPTAFDRSAPLEALIEQGVVFAGTPDTVVAQIKRHHAAVGGYGHILMMGQAGFLEHDETVKGITLYAREVYPRVRALGAQAATV
jgi:alkanesulfonate monooxygenase SsuD/methylene tetrahydromethanopterin reductase-like flavin-dependent oxidoreductase (luciferase family)